MSLWFNVNINWGTLQYISHCTPPPFSTPAHHNIFHTVTPPQHTTIYFTLHPPPMTQLFQQLQFYIFLAMYSKPQFSGPSTNNYRITVYQNYTVRLHNFSKLVQIIVKETSPHHSDTGIMFCTVSKTSVHSSTTCKLHIQPVVDMNITQ
jgi:hypothetical protein